MRVVVFGHDRFRQLGLGQHLGSDEMRTMPFRELPYYGERRQVTPQEVERLRASRVAGVACRCQFSCAVTEEGKLLTWGEAPPNGNQLGHGLLPEQTPEQTFTVVAAPRLVTGGFVNGTRIATVAAGGAHMACVSALGQVYSWGMGGMGQLGHGEDTLIDAIDIVNIPRRVEGLAGKRIVGLDCGQWVTLVLASSGEVFEFGCDDPGGGVSEKHLTPQLVTFPPLAAPLRRISCGDTHKAAVDTNGILFTWGSNGKTCIPSGQLGYDPYLVLDSDGNEVEDPELHDEMLNELMMAPQLPRAIEELVSAGQRVATVSCGSKNTAVVTETGQLWIWGCGTDGQLGNGNDITTPGVQQFEGDRWYSEWTPQRVTNGLPGGEAAVVREVSCGHDHTVVALASGEVLTFGKGDYGMLGHGESEHADANRMGEVIYSDNVLVPRVVAGLLV
jgi:alpha-tubulin suppressor-like RCC1 family protein